jgi:hypothetical protein
MRPDGHADREVIENWILFGGPKRDSRNGQDCTPPGAPNAFAFRAGTGNCRMCSSNAVWAAMPERPDCTDWQ